MSKLKITIDYVVLASIYKSIGKLCEKAVELLDEAAKKADVKESNDV